VISVGGAQALGAYINPENNNDPYHGLMAIGFIASFSQKLAQALFAVKIDETVMEIFTTSKQANCREAAAWAMGLLGKHSPQQASTLMGNGAIDQLLATFESADASDEVKLKTKRALKLIIGQTQEIHGLREIVGSAPEPIRHYLLRQIAKLLAGSEELRTEFAARGGIDALAGLGTDVGAKSAVEIKRIKDCYPAESPKAPVAEPPETIEAD
jgi:hypothetical protein